MRCEEGVWRESWQLLFFVSVLHQRLEEWHSPWEKHRFDAEQELKSRGGRVLLLSGKDLQKAYCKLTGFVTLHLCLCLFVPASLPIVSQKLLLKEVFLYWGDNKLLIVLQAPQSFLPSTTSLFVFAQFQELSHFCVWLPMSVVRVEVKCIRAECELPHLTISHYSWHGCIMLDWFSCFCLSPGNYILCSLCCWI